MAFVICWQDSTLSIARNSKQLRELIAGKCSEVECLLPCDSEAEAFDRLNARLMTQKQ